MGMMDDDRTQCCPLTSNDDYDNPSCMTTSTPTARKIHRCCECGEDIPRGAKYERITGVWDGSPDTFKTCLSCVEIREHFRCGGYLIGQLWDDLADNLFPTMPAGGPCMRGLSPAAKARLFERRLAWQHRRRGGSTTLD